MVVHQYEIFLVSLDPTVGHEIRKSRPCLVLSPDEMNEHLATVIIAPMTTKSHFYPTRVPVTFKGRQGWIIIDQIRTVDKHRLAKKIGIVSPNVVGKVKAVLQEMLVD
jgi:mRNA interferase MazF